jgi:hypothetical protein
MLPILLLEIFYKIIWLVVVAYPPWAHDRLTGPPAEGMTFAFAWFLLPIVAVPWPDVVRTFVLGRASGAA